MSKRLFAILLVVVALLAAGCSNASTPDSALSSDIASMDSAQEFYASGEDALSSEDLTSTGAPVSSGRKLVFSSDLTIETLEFDDTVARIRELVAQLGGYMERSEIEGSSYGAYSVERTAEFVARVPSARYDEANTALGGMGNVRQRHESADDITDAYYDLQAELDALKVQQERLLAMMEQTTNMDTLIALEQELTQVRYRINERTSAIMRYDGLVEYSTITIYLNEVVVYAPVDEPIVTFGDRVRNTFLDSIAFIKEFGQGIILVIVAVAPFVIFYGGILAIIVLLILLPIRLSRRKKK